MKKRAFRVRAAGVVQALLMVFLVTQCGPPKRDFSGGSGAGGTGGAAGAGGKGGAAGKAGSAGRSSGVSGRAGDDSAGEGPGSDAGFAGLASGGSDNVGGSSGGSSTVGGSGGSAGATVGTACSVNGDCALGNCIDGVCCESACTGCKACSGTLTGKSDGTCAPVVGGQDPHNTCADVTATNECGTDGACDGSGACRKISSSHVCGAASCTGSTFKPVATCDGAGACGTPTTENCGAYPCTTSGCAKTCMAQTDCSGTNYCKITSGNSGTCTAKNPNGTVATSAFECSSNVVADGVCCDTACTGCKACSGSPLTGGAVGQCSNIVAGKVAHSACTNSGTVCGLDGLCDGAGACEYSPKQGASCDSASNKCLTGAKCSAGACTGAVAVVCPAPTAQCLVANCVPATGCGFANASSTTTCTDNNACTTGDLCQNGSCVSGSPMACNPAKLCKTASTCSGGVCSTQGNVAEGNSDPTCPSSTPNCLNGACVRCSRDSQCNTGELCDLSAHTCSCRKPSSTNKLADPGFDAGVASWVSPSSVTLSTDVDSCAGSTSVYTQSTENNPKQCVPGSVSQGTTYFWGGKFKGPATGSFLRVHFYAGAGCTGGEVFGPTETVLYLPGDTNWAPHSTSVMAPTGAVSADIGVYGITTYFDQLYFGTADKF